jgi:hypothetical protein
VYANRAAVSGNDWLAVRKRQRARGLDPRAGLSRAGIARAIAVVRDGEPIVIDVERRQLSLHPSAKEPLVVGESHWIEDGG